MFDGDLKEMMEIGNKSVKEIYKEYFKFMFEQTYAMGRDDEYEKGLLEFWKAKFKELKEKHMKSLRANPMADENAIKVLEEIYNFDKFEKFIKQLHADVLESNSQAMV